MRRTFRSWALVAVVLVAVAVLAAGPAAAAKKPLSYSAYNAWRSIQSTQMARDGAWLVYALVPQDGDGELVVRNLKTDKEFRSPRGQSPVLTVDGKFVVFTIMPLKAEMDKAKKDKKKPEEQPKNGLGVMNLATGEVTAVERVKGFKVPEESGAYIAYLLETPVKKDEKPADPAKKEEAKAPEAKAPETKPGEAKSAADVKKPKEKKKDPGTELVIRELATGRTVSVPEVVEYIWNKPGSWLGYAVSAKKPEDDGAYAWQAADGTTVLLAKGLGHYKSLTFDDKGGQLAFLSDRDEYKKDASAFKLYHWVENAAAATEAVPAAKGLPVGQAVSENGRLQFSKDGARLFFGYADASKAEPEDAPEPVKVDIWSWKDADLQPMQKINADQDKKRNYAAVFQVKEKKLVVLGGPDLASVAAGDDPKFVVGQNDKPYRQMVSWDQGYADVYLISLADGSRKKVLEKFPGNASLSPGGRFLSYYDQAARAWFAYRLLDGKTFDLTSKLPVKFHQEEWDSPSEPGNYGSAGWTDGDKALLLYDQYDIWEINPDGSGARNATKGVGRRDGLIFRYLRLDREERTVPAKTPILLQTVDDKTKATGYYRVNLAVDAAPSKVFTADKLIGGLIKAKNAEIYAFTQQTFAEFPNLWTSGPEFADRRKVSDANPQQTEYNWGTSELIKYRNADGVVLDAILTKPEDFDPSKKYPLMVYIYEKLADGLHRHQAPAPGTSINFTRYASNGYIILQPDIVYEIGYPGSSALKCVVPAVQKVVDMGFIDPARIGIQGHSWGGYQITYLITQTDIFAAVQAGASVSNMTSAYGGIRWGSGMVREFQYEKTQSRIGAPLFSRVLQYLENSPVFWAERVKTPYLSIHNDDDDAVPWYQGIEFFTALRRLGKEAYMFNFNGEKHGLRERENMKYWTLHQDEFFDHYLLGKPRPAWMDTPVPFLERGKRDVNALYKGAEKK
ncbi:MAG: prolyl oligopeptidase family serine peptidase [Candidatus Aminicenantes bacterium]|nr:prolyl oligopeptidase family serine peptidase [Candidatus Aminicenantes bacterium]